MHKDHYLVMDRRYFPIISIMIPMQSDCVSSNRHNIFEDVTSILDLKNGPKT